MSAVDYRCSHVILTHDVSTTIRDIVANVCMVIMEMARSVSKVVNLDFYCERRANIIAGF